MSRGMEIGIAIASVLLVSGVVVYFVNKKLAANAAAMVNNQTYTALTPGSAPISTIAPTPSVIIDNPNGLQQISNIKTSVGQATTINGLAGKEIASK